MADDTLKPKKKPGEELSDEEMSWVVGAGSTQKGRTSGDEEMDQETIAPPNSKL